MKTNFNLNTPKILSSLFIASALAFCFTSCKKNDNTVSVSAYISATNAAQASSPQDFYVDNQQTASAIVYNQSSSYATVNAGSHQGVFKASGTSTVSSSTALSLSAGNYYSVFYTDDKSTVTAQDDRTTPQSGKSRVRFINLSTGLSTTTDFALAGGTKLVSGLAYKAASAYYDVDAASAFSIYLSGSSTVLLSVPASLQAGHIYTIFISGTTQATVNFHIKAEN